MAAEKERINNKDIMQVLSHAKEVIELYQRTIQSISSEPIDKLGSIVREERKKQKIPREVLAKLSGVSVGTIIAIESGKNSASLSNVQKILQALGRKLWIR